MLVNVILQCGTGINQSDLVVLESHVVYSLSKEKTAARFYIMQSTRSISEELQVPIKDVIERLVQFFIGTSLLLVCGGRQGVIYFSSDVSVF